MFLEGERTFLPGSQVKFRVRVSFSPCLRGPRKIEPGSRTPPNAELQTPNSERFPSSLPGGGAPHQGPDTGGHGQIARALEPVGDALGPFQDLFVVTTQGRFD